MNLTTLIERFGGECFWCGKTVSSAKRRSHPDSPTRDHVIPLSQGGAPGASNIVLACFACNQAKGDLHYAQLAAAWLVVKAQLVLMTPPPPRENRPKARRPAVQSQDTCEAKTV